MFVFAIFRDRVAIELPSSCAQFLQFVPQEKTRTSAGQPDTAAFLGHQDLINFSKRPDVVDKLEQELKSIRSKFLPILDRSLSHLQSRLEVGSLADLLVRSAFCKALPSNFKVKKVPGKLSVYKVNMFKIVWAKVIDEKYPLLGFSVEADLVPPDAEKTEDDKFLEEIVDPKHLGLESPAHPQEDHRSEVHVGW